MSNQAPLLFYRFAGVGGLLLGLNNYLAHSTHPSGPVDRNPLLTAGQKTIQSILRSPSSSSGTQATTSLVDITLVTFVKYVGGVTIVTIGAWQTYSFVSNNLPDYITAVLPVTTSAFNAATTKLARGILNVKDSLIENFLSLSMKQDEFGRKQNETHREVLNVKNSVFDLKNTVDSIQSSLDMNERMSLHNAKGVRLVTRAVSSLIPHEVELVKEMKQYEKDGHNLPSIHHQEQSNSRFSHYESSSSSTADGCMNLPLSPRSSSYINNHNNNQFLVAPRQQQQLQQYFTSPEREVEIPVPEIGNRSSIIDNYRGTKIFPGDSCEGKNEKDREDESFKDIKDMATRMLGM